MLGTLIELSGCANCQLRQEWQWLQNPRMQMTMPTVPRDLKVLMIGEAPGETEDIEGRQFVGKTGQFLRERIPDEWKQSLYWTNLVRCRPPRNRTPEDGEILSCCGFLEEELNSVQPNVIVTIGDTALSYFCEEESVTKIRGIPIPVEIEGAGITSWLYPIFHPSYVVRMGSGSDENPVLPVFEADLRNLFGKMDSFAERPTIATIPEATEIYFPKSYEEAWSCFERLANPYSIDLETYQKKPFVRDARLVTAAFSDGNLTFAIPCDWPGYENTWGKKFVVDAVQRGTWIAHNSSFELAWLWYLTQNPNLRYLDSMALARLYHQRTGILSLGTQTRIHLGRNIKKVTEVDAKKILSYPLPQVLYYNGLDSWSEALLYKDLESCLSDPLTKSNYNRILDTVRSTVAMELTGLPVDLEEAARQKQELYGKQEAAREGASALPEVKEFEQKENKQFSVSNPKDVAAVLTRYCAISLPKSEKGNYSTNANDLEKLAGKHPLVDLTLDYREVQKLLSTYVEPILQGRHIGIDGLIHPSYTVVLTNTSRLSSEDPNIQNFPKRKHKEIRKMLVAPPGHILAAFDYGQLEARCICMLSGDKNLRQQTIDKVDIHTKWLNKIIDAYPEYLDRLARKTGQTDEKKIRKAGRDIVKTDFVFASFYGSWASSVAKHAMIPGPIANDLLSEFWEEYSGVKAWADEQFARYRKTGTIANACGRVRTDVLWGNEPINTPVQGTGAEIVLEAQNALFRRAMTEDIYFLPRINIHDDITVILPDDDRTEQYIKTIGDEIVTPRFDFIIVPLLTECKVGYNWAEMEEVAKIEGDYIRN